MYALAVVASAAALVLAVAPAATAVDGSDTISLVAGTGGSGYSGDGGPGTDAQLDEPAHVASDAAGNLYVADRGNHRVRRIDATTGVITTVVGNGGADFPVDGGAADSSPLGDPFGVAFDPSGNLYVSQPGFSVVRRVDAATGVITTVAGDGTFGHSGDGGPATDAQLRSPYGLAFDASGNLYIAVRAGQRVRRVDAATGVITTVAGNGSQGYSGDGGLATDAELRQPYDVAVDGSGNLYIVDSSAAVVRRVDADTGVITTVAGNGTLGNGGDGGPATDAQLWAPQALAFGPDGALYIGSGGASTVRRVDTDGTITTVAGDGTFGASGDGGAATDAQIGLPNGVDVTASGRLAISSDGLEPRVWAVTPPASAPGAPTSVTAVAGIGSATVSWSAPASDGGSPVTGYTVTATPGGATCTTDGPTTCQVTGLEPGTTYTFAVTATNAVSAGPASDSSEGVEVLGEEVDEPVGDEPATPPSGGEETPTTSPGESDVTTGPSPQDGVPNAAGGVAGAGGAGTTAAPSELAFTGVSSSQLAAAALLLVAAGCALVGTSLRRAPR